jgi:alanyl-tRNA synthetase
MGVTSIAAIAVWNGISWIDVQTIDPHSEQSVIILLNQTPFYGESGGQEGDTGLFKIENNLPAFQVTHTHKIETWHIHEGHCFEPLSINQNITAIVDEQRRQGLCIHHSATHLLNRALRDHLGCHVTQKGSLVSPDRLRFDFSHQGPLTIEQKESIEIHMWHAIQNNTSVETILQNPTEALQSEVISIPGERYPEEARVIRMGASAEFCGGTHVKHTGDIGGVMILSENGIAAGVRRIEMTAGISSLKMMHRWRQEGLKTAQLLQTSWDQCAYQTQLLTQEMKALKKKYQTLYENVAIEQCHQMQTAYICEKNDLLWFVYDGRSLGWTMEFMRVIRDHLIKNSKPKASFLNEKKSYAMLFIGKTQNNSEIPFCLQLEGDIEKKDLNTHTAKSLALQLTLIFGGKGGGNTHSAQGHLTRFSKKELEETFSFKTIL